jgi:predicted HicB family RNase H-like nuclease
MKKRQSDKNKTKQVRIDVELHRLLKIKAAEEKTTLRALLEQQLADMLGVPPH